MSTATHTEKNQADKAGRQVFEVSVDYSQISRVVLRPLFCAGENLPHQLVGPTLNFLSAILHCPGASRLYVSELVPTGDTRQKTVRFRRGRALELTLSALRALETLFSDLSHGSSPADGASATGDAGSGAPTSGSALPTTEDSEEIQEPCPCQDRDWFEVIDPLMEIERALDLLEYLPSSCRSPLPHLSPTAVEGFHRSQILYRARTVGRGALRKVREREKARIGSFDSTLVRSLQERVRVLEAAEQIHVDLIAELGGVAGLS